MEDPQRPSGRTIYLTAHQVAEWLGLSTKTIFRMAQRGEIPSIKVGRATRFRQESIEAWMLAQEAAA